MPVSTENTAPDVLNIQGVGRRFGGYWAVRDVDMRIGAGERRAVLGPNGAGKTTLFNALTGARQRVGNWPGVTVEKTAAGMRVKADEIRGVDVMTEPFPGFPTDLQAQMMAMLATADGASMITETIFENRFMHVPELMRMGANINLHGRSAMVRGSRELKGAEVMATDLRASVSLVIAALAAKGETTVNRVFHLDRGYERVEDKLAACGADIERISG